MNTKTKKIIVDAIIIFIITISSLALLYPFYYVAINSFNADIGSGAAMLWPSRMSIRAYELIFTTNNIVNAFIMSVLRTIIGAFISLAVCSLAAFSLRKRKLSMRNLYLIFFTVPMFFSGGLIPLYLNYIALGLYNSFLVYIIPGAWSFFWTIILMTSFNDLPEALEESARIDGASHLRILIQIFIPISIPVLATIGLFAAVNQWNSWFDTLYFTTDSKLMTLAGVLMQIINRSQMGSELAQAGVSSEELWSDHEAIKLATSIVAITPILIIYPFLQRYFIKGLTLGSIKG